MIGAKSFYETAAHVSEIKLYVRLGSYREVAKVLCWDQRDDVVSMILEDGQGGYRIELTRTEEVIPMRDDRFLDDNVRIVQLRKRAMTILSEEGKIAR